MTYRRFKCGRCHRDLKQSEEGTVFDGHRPIGDLEVSDCPTCWAWLRRLAPFTAKRQGES